MIVVLDSWIARVSAIGVLKYPRSGTMVRAKPEVFREISQRGSDRSLL